MNFETKECILTLQIYIFQSILIQRQNSDLPEGWDQVPSRIVLVNRSIKHWLTEARAEFKKVVC